MEIKEIKKQKKPRRTIRVPVHAFKKETCSRCNGDGKDPHSQVYTREFGCKKCKSVGWYWMIDPEWVINGKVLNEKG